MRYIGCSRLFFPTALLASLCSIQGCSDSSSTESSSDFATSAITANYSVAVRPRDNSTGADYQMEARFFRNNDLLELDGGDQIEVLNGSDSYRLAEQKAFGVVAYLNSQFIENGEAPSNLTFSFTRESQDDADLSLVVIPEQLEIITPLDNDVVSLNNGRLMLQWQNNDDNAEEITIFQRYRCSTQDSGQVEDGTRTTTTEDDGLYVLDIVGGMDGQDFDSCRLDLEFTRKRVGNLDNALKSGSTDGLYIVEVNNITFDL